MLSSSSLTLAWVSGAPADLGQPWAFTATAQAALVSQMPGCLSKLRMLFCSALKEHTSGATAAG
jgi:hypothetical protein